jgi:8-oxo-dGTP pyrophosphatase MutT (NUDIX family)
MCGQPVSSFGIICFRRRAGSEGIEYLLVQRKDSLAYVEFIRGKYSLQNRTYLLRLLSNMTCGERDSIRSTEFDQLWHGFWQSDHSRSFMKEYDQSRTRFETLRRGYYLRPPSPPQQQDIPPVTTADGTPPPPAGLHLFGLGIALDATRAEHDDTEFGFPKGRRNVNESDMQCAMREFTEESGISASDLRLCCGVGQHQPFEEVFTGSNNVRYRHVYYLAELRQESRAMANVGIQPVVDAIQLREVKAVGWFSSDGVLARIREQNVERRNLFMYVNALLVEHGRRHARLQMPPRPTPPAHPTHPVPPPPPPPHETEANAARGQTSVPCIQCIPCMGSSTSTSI